MNQFSYTTNDLLLLLGQSTVEIAWQRGRIAELETRLQALESARAEVELPNGQLTPHAVMQT